MKLKDMIELLRGDYNYWTIELRDLYGNTLFICSCNSKIIQMFYDYEIKEWFPDSAPFKNVNFTVYLNYENN